MSKNEDTLVLVADDEPSMLALLSAYIRSKGYRVLEASDGDMAWQLAREHLPHAVVLDVMMPGMSGWEVCKKIRESVSLAHTGVVMLTGIGESLNELTSPLYGADAYIDKPFEFAELEARIKETLERRRDGALGRPDAGSDDDDDSDEENEDDDSDDSDDDGDDAPKAKGKGKAKTKAKSKAASDDDDDDDSDEDDEEDDEDEDERPSPRPKRGGTDEEDPVTQRLAKTALGKKAKKKASRAAAASEDGDLGSEADVIQAAQAEVRASKKAGKKAGKKAASKKAAKKAAKKAPSKKKASKKVAKKAAGKKTAGKKTAGKKKAAGKKTSKKAAKKAAGKKKASKKAASKPAASKKAAKKAKKKGKRRG